MDPNYPRVLTGPVTNINPGGAMFNASFLDDGDGEIIDHGFVYGKNSPIITKTTGGCISLGPSQGKGSFRAFVSTNLEKGEEYYVSAYAQNKDHIYYSEAISFESQGSEAPIINSIFPCEGMKYDTVLIKGKNFNPKEWGNTVYVGQEQSQIINSSDSSLKIIIPPSKGNEIADIFVTTAGQTSQLIDAFRYFTPQIIGINHHKAVIGDTIELTGKYFQYPVVHFNQTKATLLEITSNKIRIIVPALESIPAKISVTVDDFMVSTDYIFSYKKPEIIQLFPDNGIAGDTLIIQGNDFGYDVNYVKAFVGEETVKIIESNNTFIKIIVPTSQNSPSLPVSIQVAGQIADGYKNFTYNTPDITDIYPTSEKTGSLIEIRGKGFLTIKSFNLAYIDQIKLPVKEARPNYLIVRIPDTIYSITSPIKVKVEQNQTLSHNNFEIISPWTKKSNFPGYNLNSAVGFSVSDFGYVTGGTVNYPNGTHTSNEHLWQYRWIDDTWIEKNRAISIRYPAFEIDDMIYCTDAWDRFFMYQLINDQWTNCGSTIRSNRFFIVDQIGYVLVSNNSGIYETWGYDHINGIWSYINTVRSNFIRAFSIDKKGYAIFRNILMEYNTLNDFWKEVMQLPSGLTLPDVFIANNKAFLISNGYTNNNIIWQYDPQTNICEKKRLFPTLCC
ncbi:MAG: IPT/TIG domain-containing protein [Bacteroidales bacterium]|nr:IPT/TIG domain-containing protein [Bacteroidales bacterium]